MNRVAIIGSRTFNDYDFMVESLEEHKIDIKMIVSGGAKGADSLAERYAKKKGIPLKVFRPDWNKYGKVAGLLRNTDIINEADIVIAFWDGQSRGTKDSIDKATGAHKIVHIYRYV